MNATDAIAIVTEVMEVECERCGDTKEIAFHPSLTAYADEEVGAGYWFCEDCSKEYADYWDDMWKEYIHSR